jgi:ABC-2 type transport system ATP-binding protein
MIDYALETRNLTKHMGGRRIVRSVSLQIPKGSVYGLLGPNGAGKSTTLKLLTGLMCPSEGEVRIFGKPWSRDCLGRIGALIETPALYGNLTAYENLLVHSRLRGLPQGEIDKVLVITGLEATGKQLVSQFSLGMKQRLGLAIALLGDPEILILDEPTNGLDPIGIEEFRELIRSLHSSGKTILLSSHILSEVAQLVDHIGIISDGELKLQAPIGQKDDLEALFLQIVRGKTHA